MNPITSSALIVIRRPTNFWMGGLRSFVVRIDGRKVGKIKPGIAAEFPVAPGEHTVAVSMDWIRSRPYRLAVEPESRTELAIGSRPGGILKMFVPLVLIVLIAHVIAAAAVPADSGWLPRIALFLVAYAALFAGYLLMTVSFAGDYWALFTLEPASAGAPGDGIRGKGR